MKSRMLTWIRIAPAIVGMIGLFVLSSIPQLRPPGPDFDFKDKLYHAAAYFVLTLSFALAIRAIYPNLDMKRVVVYSILAGIVYGASDELHQSFVPTRMAGWDDLVADTVGALLTAPVSPGCTCFLLSWFSRDPLS